MNAPNVALENLAPTNAVMTDSQRRCLLHVFRNSAADLEGLVMLLEQRESLPSTDDLHGCVRGVVRSLMQANASLYGGSFCTLTADQCSFVAPFVACSGAPVEGVGKRSALPHGVKETR